VIITVLDTETTGLNPKRHEVIEVAYISYVIDREGKFFLLRRFESKIAPTNIGGANPKALEINGYTKEKWRDAPDKASVLCTVSKAISETDVLIGQNLIFDLRFLDKEFERYKIDPPFYPPYVDTKAMADVLVKKNWLRRSKMDYLVEHYGVKVSGRAHTALVDCARTYEVWQRLLNDTDGEYDLYTFENPYDW